MGESGYVMMGDLERSNSPLLRRSMRRRTGVGSSAGSILPGSYSPVSDLTAATPGKGSGSGILDSIKGIFTGPASLFAPSAWTSDKATIAAGSGGPPSDWGANAGAAAAGAGQAGAGILSSIFGGAGSIIGGAGSAASSIIGAAAPAIPGVLTALLNQKNAPAQMALQQMQIQAQAAAAAERAKTMKLLALGALGLGALYLATRK